MRKILTFFFLLFSVPSFAQVLNITTSGTHTLSSNLVSTTTVVSINVDNVVLDLNGFTIRCNPLDPFTAITIGVSTNGHSNIVIKRGSITGCFFGIHGSYNNSLILEDLNLSANTYIGANLGYGQNNIVRRVTCANISGYTAEAYAICINGIGSNGVVEDSTFTDIYKQAGSSGVGEGVAILVEANAINVQLRRNNIRNNTVTQNTIGIWGATGSSATVSYSTICGFNNSIMNIIDGGNNTFSPSVCTPSSGTKFFKICELEGSTLVCYEGTLTKPLE